MDGNDSLLKVAFVTGGSGGIGRATAIELARKGWAIAVGYRNGETEAKETLDAVVEAGSNGTTVHIDVGEEASVIEAFRAAAEALGTINGLVNSAGMTRDGLTVKYPAETFDATMRINVTGSF